MGLFIKSNERDIFDGFISSFTPNSGDSTCNLTSQIHTFDTVLSHAGWAQVFHILLSTRVAKQYERHGV